MTHSRAFLTQKSALFDSVRTKLGRACRDGSVMTAARVAAATQVHYISLGNAIDAIDYGFVVGKEPVSSSPPLPLVLHQIIYCSPLFRLPIQDRYLGTI